MAAMTFAVGSMGKWLVEKAVFPKEVTEEVESVIAGLRGMECFLKDAEQKQATNESIQKWIFDIRDVAYDAEDAIENFIFKVENAGIITWFCFPGDSFHINTVIKEIKSIRKRLVDIGKRRETLGIQNPGEVNDSSRGILENVERLRRLSPLHKVKYVVGLNNDVDILLRTVILNKERKGLYLAAIVGMGGSGKSTLAKEIFNYVARRFHYRVWVVVSSEFSHVDIIKQILMKISGVDLVELEKSIKDKLEFERRLGDILYQQLNGKTYFIVLDDMWDRQHWESLRSAFPNEEDRKGRLLFTSRDKIIGDDDGYIHNMRLLNEDESWQLLMKTTSILEIDGKCPQELEYIGREIMQECSGIPLAIIVAGGLLANEGESSSGWENVLKQIKNYRLETNNDIVYAILELSYQNLPPRLKACFLCLGFFKEDAVIRAKELVHIWIGKGLISCEEGGGMTEEIGRGFLNELVNRNLVQVKDMRIDGQIKTCHLHYLLHELSRRKAKEEIGMEILGRENSSTSSYKPRHSVVYYSSNRVFSMSDSSNDQNKHLRSLFVYGSHLDKFSSSSYWKRQQSFERLRILDFYHYEFGNFPNMIHAFIRLRYLRIRCGLNCTKLPKWLDHLKNLEVLVIDGYSGMKLTDDRTWKIDSLRHFKVESMMTGGYMKIGSWKNLETLKYIDANSLIFDDEMTSFRICKLGKRIPPNFSAIRKLGIRIPPNFSEDRNRLHELLKQMHNLVQLHIKLSPLEKENSDVLGRMPLDMRLTKLLDLDQLTKLKLDGRMHMPAELPLNLCHLTLSWTQLEEDPMPVLGKLPKLLSLKFYYAYQFSEMRVLPNGFPSLKLLSLQWLYLLHLIEIEEGAMPQLQRFEIVQCELLNIENIPERLKSTVTTIVN